MVYAYYMLKYFKLLRDASLPAEQDEADVEAARDFIMTELVTKTDLNAEIDSVRRELAATADGLRRDNVELRRYVDDRMERQTLQLTVRLGGLMIAGIGVLAVTIELL